MEEKYLTPKEAAKVLKCCYSTMLLMIYSGDIKAINISKGKRSTWRIPVEALNNFKYE